MKSIIINHIIVTIPAIIKHSELHIVYFFFVLVINSGSGVAGGVVRQLNR